MDESFFNQFVGILKDEAPTPEEYKAWKKEEKLKLRKQPGNEKNSFRQLALDSITQTGARL